MDVLNDFCDEAAEVYEHNPWIRVEMGYQQDRFPDFDFDFDFDLDMINYKQPLLTNGQIRDYCLLLFGVNQCDGLPDPSTDWKGFAENVDRLMSKEEENTLQWTTNQRKKKVMPWIYMKKLNKIYGDKAGCVVI